jgi:hypothetical protein
MVTLKTFDKPGASPVVEIQYRKIKKSVTMAIIPQGITGPFIGRVGPVVGYISRGKSVMRGRPNVSKSRKPSPLQRQQHAKFSLMNKFLGPIIPFLNETKKTVDIDLTGYNKAFSYNVKNAIAGTYPDLIIDYSMVLLTRGDLPNIKSFQAKSQSTGQITFNWTDNSGTGLARPDDKAFLAVCCPAINQWICELNLTERSAGNCIFNVTLFSGRTVQIYMGFLSSDGKEVSDSLYMGSAQIE